MTRDGFVFYRSFKNTIRKLNDADRLAAYDALTDFGLDGTEPEDGVSAAIVEAFRLVIESNNRKYENGSRGGRPKNENQTETKPEPKHNQTITKPEPNDNLKDKREKIKDKREIDKTYTGDASVDEAVKTFIQYRKEIKKPMGDVSINRFVKRLLSLSDTPEGQVALINEAIEKSWLTVYPPKEQPKTKPKARQPSFENQRAYDYDALERSLLGRTYG